jgi:hypothetical protein
MAGDWIKMRMDLFTHPKVFRIAERLGKDELYVVGALLAFWSWAHSHAVDGHVDGATSRLVDAATRVDGLHDALLEVGWLHVDATGITIPRFDVHNGDSAKERCSKSERQARWRAKKKQQQAALSVDGAVDEQPSTREEKRREEINTPKPPRGEAYEGFDRFWDAWPKSERKVGRKPCLDKWKRKNLEAKADEIIAHVTAMRQTKKWLDGYDPSPQTYLNQELWRDGVPTLTAIPGGRADIFAGAL